MNLNKAMLIGNLTRDPEVRTTPTGKNVTQFSVATNRVWTNAAGAKQEEVEYHNIVAWGRLADICGQYLKKGRKAYVEGRLRTRDWVGQDGVKRYRTEIIADNMIILDRAPGAPTAAPVAGAQYVPTSEPIVPPVPTGAGADMPPVIEEEVKLEDIPF